MKLIVKREQLYFVGLFLYVIRNFVIYTGNVLPGILLTIFLYTAIACWGICMLMQYKKVKQFMINLVLIILGYINAKLTGTWNITVVFMIIIASQGISLKRIIHFIMRMNVVLLSFIIMSYFICLLFGTVSITQVREVDGEVVLRHKFFFNNANGFSMYFIFTVLMYVYLNYEHIRKMKLYLVLFVAVVFIYIFPNTRTVCILGVVFILFDFLKERKVGKLVKWICKNSFLICFFMTFIFLMIFIENPHTSIGAIVNKMMNGRLTMVAGALELYDLTLLGQTIVNEKVYSPNFGYFILYLDNFYGMLVIRYGIIMTIIFSYYFVKTGKRLFHNDQWIELLLFSLVFIFGLSESMTLEIYPIFPLLFMRESIICDKTGK